MYYDMSGCRESNSGHTHPMGAYYHCTTSRTKITTQQTIDAMGVPPTLQVLYTFWIFYFACS